MPAASRGRTTAAVLSRAAVLIACTVGAAACTPTSSNQSAAPPATPQSSVTSAPPTRAADPPPASAQAASDPGCVRALDAVSRYGPAAVREDVGFHRVLDKAEIGLLVFALDGAADATGNPGTRQSIHNLADAYLSFRQAWTGAVAPSVESILADTNHLKSRCRS